MPRLRPLTIALCMGLAGMASPANAQFDPALVPVYSIWNVTLGQPVSQIPAMEVVEISCGTNGGPPSVKLAAGFSDFARCPAEPSGLHEVYFENDDEIDYLARAQEAEYKVLQGGTSIYAHPVMVSVLVDDEAIVRGIRIVTDERVSTRERRVAVTLARNLKGRYGSWKQTCDDLPPRAGENPVGNQFIHEICTAESPDGTERMRLESSFLRKKGQDAFNTDTQQLNVGYFQSQTRLEVVQTPYEPSLPPS